MSTPHIPLLRAGEPYRSQQLVTLHDPRDGHPVAVVSQAIPGLITRDLARLPQRRTHLDALPVAELLAIGRTAATQFATAELPLGDGHTQSPEDYLESLAATTGLPLTLGRRNLARIEGVLTHMDEILRGLTRGLDPACLDDPDRQPSYQARSHGLGAVLPSNSPGVHGLWLPAIGLKMPLVLKPGREEPWTPYRLANALFAAGLPKAAIHFYPSGHDGAIAVLLHAGASLLFGDGATVAPWRGDGRIEIHGPGVSKVVLGEDAATHFEPHLDLIESSICVNSGRSCLNASGVWTTGRGDELAEALAARLAHIVPHPLDHPAAELAAFANPAAAAAIDRHLDRLLAIGGAEDVSQRHRAGPRLVELDGSTFLLPTIIRCGPHHPLAQTELRFPFAAVVEVAERDLVPSLGRTLVVTALGESRTLREALLQSRHIDRLNLGAVPTHDIAWGEPHEGNLFELLYRRRALRQLC